MLYYAMLCYAMLCNALMLFDAMEGSGRFWRGSGKPTRIKQANKQAGKRASKQERERAKLRYVVFSFLGRDYMSPVTEGGYCTCALAHHTRPIRNIEWRLQQDVNRRCFAMQQDVLWDTRL